MKTDTAERMQRLIDAGIAKAEEIITITDWDGSTHQAPRRHASIEDGDFQVYVVPVDGRNVRVYRPHYRTTFYVRTNGQFRRVNREAFIKAMDA